MSDFLARYSLREKTIVALLLLVVIGLSLHALIVEPYQQRVADLHAQIEQQTADLVWMKSAVANLPSAQLNSVTIKIDGTLANFINQAVRRQGLSGQLSQMSPIGNDEIRMRYSAVDFNRLIDFVAQVRSSGLEVKDMRISAADNPGIVDSNMVLVRQ